MKEPILILVAIFVILGFAYAPLKEDRLRVNKSENSPSTSSSIGKVDSVSSTNHTNKDTYKEIKNVEEEIKKLEEEIKNVEKESKRSPYYNKIKMSNISSVNAKDPTDEYIRLSVNLKDDENVNITGWYLKSEVTSYAVIIGQTALLPFPFTKTETDIILQKGDRVILTKGFSPIGISLRTNKCAGFLGENRDFRPGLPKQCPLPRDEKLPLFSNDLDRDDECIRIIERIPRCKTIGNEFLRDLPDTVTRSCKNYMTTQINYNACVAKHFGDTDFPGHEYRVYLNKFGPVWRPSHDTINLHDRNGMIVDTVSY